MKITNTSGVHLQLKYSGVAAKLKLTPNQTIEIEDVEGLEVKSIDGLESSGWITVIPNLAERIITPKNNEQGKQQGKKIGVVTKANQIPTKSIVTKRNGTVEYRLLTDMPIYGKGQQKLKTQGIVYLVKRLDPDYITALAENTKLVWWTTETEYYRHLKGRVGQR